MSRSLGEFGSVKIYTDGHMESTKTIFLDEPTKRWFKYIYPMYLKDNSEVKK